MRALSIGWQTNVSREMAVIFYRNIAFDVVDDPTKGIYYVFGVRKSGSSILNNITQALAEMNGIHYVDVAGTLFTKGIRVREWQRDVNMCALVRPGNLYGGFRDFPFGLAAQEAFSESKKMLMVRDPRDALVSEYYSNAYSHSVPKAGETRGVMLSLRESALGTPIDAYVLERAAMLRQTLRDFTALKPDRCVKVIRYEDVITRKRELLYQLCSFYSWPISEAQADAIIGWADVFPEVERPTEFIRKVIPGDYREKLLPETLRSLNEFFASEMECFGYV
jgi:hypothetical protein